MSTWYNLLMDSFSPVLQDMDIGLGIINGISVELLAEIGDVRTPQNTNYRTIDSTDSDSSSISKQGLDFFEG